MSPPQATICVSSRHHTIRPHHVVLLTIIEKLFTTRENELPSDFVLHAYRILLQEIAEVAKPRSLEDLMTELARWKGEGDRMDVSMFLDGLEMEKHQELRSMEAFNDFMRRISTFTKSAVDEDEETGYIMARRSIFGFFTRRMYISYLKLSPTGVRKLQDQYLAWCTKKRIPDSYSDHDKSFFTKNSILMFRTSDDNRAYAVSDPLEIAEKGMIVGEVMTTTDQLHQFFNQRFHDANQSGLRQHDALANARAHFLRGEYGTCRRYLADCIPLARTLADKVTLQAALGLQHRIPQDDSDRLPLNDIQPHLHPFELLADVKKLLNDQHGQPLFCSFRRIFEAMALFDQWIEQHKENFIPSEQWGPHAVQSVVWDAAGCVRVAALEEQSVLAFTNIGDVDNNRITVLLNRAYKIARQGRYSEGLTLLLEPSVWRGLTMHDYTEWCHEIWHILALRASRRGQMHMYRDFLIPRAPEDFNPRNYTLSNSLKRKAGIMDNLIHVMSMRAVDQASYTMDSLLSAVWHTEFLGRMDFYRPAIMLLADVSLEFEMARRSRRLIEEIMPQVINGDDLEQRAFACFMLARCIIAEGKQSREALLEGLQWLPTAEQDYKTLEMYQSQMDVQYLISVIYHNLDMEAERDAAADRHAATARVFKAQEDVLVDKETEEILDVVASIGAALAGR
ncbi:uncharacterized protein SCHCODRAFT_02605806 [Schizophyllum commune H4-8]|uniref:uncharacterized protein n=1 Tax=Schizophyllum commune (strain H4-8 / FGSC 9210) TaxID=578458 RepID=UPI00215DE581|nr:uncharacterized protein SCHCODRAFT_02605806 [Schizophyllum commune H4-8]KAI5899674.1 hypothetical protein SCHCODRAFT_02605806 [Schizophyllum commune H4-8]